MNKSTLAGAAMVAVAAVAMPVAASAQTPAPTAPQAAAPATPHGPGNMMRHWMGRRGAMNRSPRDACIDRLARRAGVIAAVGFRLNLTAEQKPLWDKLLAATQTAEDNQRKLCAALPATAEDRGKETVIERIDHRQQMLQAHLQALQQTEPALQALYDKLTPQQKAVLDHPFRRG